MTGPIDLFIVAGQSNAQGRAPDNTSSPETTTGMCWEVTSAGTVKQMADPVGNASVGSAWPAFSNAYTATTGLPVAVSTAAVGGTYLLPEPAPAANANWAPGSTLFSTSVSRGLAAITTLNADGWTPTLRGVLWCQGEYDALQGSNPNLQGEYRAALEALLGRYRDAMSDPALKMYVFRTGRQLTGDGIGFQKVRAAQESACAEVDGMVMVYRDAVNFATWGMMADSFHYTQQGYNLMGSVGATAVAVDRGFGPQPATRRRGTSVII